METETKKLFATIYEERNPPCKVEECKRKAFAKELCRMHYKRQRRHGTTSDEVGRKRQAHKTAKVCKCGKPKTSAAAQCIECYKAGLPSAEDKKRHSRAVYLWNAYKLTLEEYDDLTANGCAVCGSYERLVIDHDHNCCPPSKKGKGAQTNRTCGKCVRGVLCNRHNLAEGYLNSDPAEAVALMLYMLGERGQ